MYRHMNMATTQVAEAEKNLHKHMTEKNRRKELKMADSRRDVLRGDRQAQIYS